MSRFQNMDRENHAIIVGGEYVFGPVKISRGSGAGIIRVPKLIAPLLVGKHVIVSLKVVESVIDQPKGD
ncbi:MAG: hypothetical protein QXJ56_07025 [Ignisphaera sp.]